MCYVGQGHWIGKYFVLVFQTMHCIVHMSTTWRLSEIKSTPAYQIAKKASTHRESYTIEELITLCSICNSQCEEIRDRIYVLLSLCKDLEIVPDYSKPTLALYLDVIQAHYRSHLYPKSISYGSDWWCEFNCGCSTFQTTRTLLGNPFWDPVNEHFTMNHSLHQYCLSQEFKETFIEVRVCAIARIYEISAILLATAPWNESAPSSLCKKISTLFPVGVPDLNCLKNIWGTYVPKDAFHTTVMRDKWQTRAEEWESDGEYREFSVETDHPDDLLWESASFKYGVGPSDIQARDIVCSFSCFDWYIIRPLKNDDSFSLVGRALIPGDATRILRRSVLSESHYAPSTYLTY